MLNLRSIDSFFLGGHLRELSGLPVSARKFTLDGAPRPVDPNGSVITGQMYVQAYRQAAPRHRLPVLLWHGGGMTGANWESTPDGRTGWLMAFLLAGFDVYVSDAVERGRSSWSRWPEIYADEPVFRTMEEGWELFRIGPPHGFRAGSAGRVVHEGQQFPSEAFDQFAAQWVPRWTGHDAITLHAYGQLLDRVGPCIVVGHSQGGGFALACARERPDMIRAVVAVEPSGAPAVDSNTDAKLQPHLVVWGDFIDQHPAWTRYRAAVDRYVDSIRQQGVPAYVLDLPSIGITGNSHFPMLDRNSDDIARRVIDWISQETLAEGKS